MIICFYRLVLWVVRKTLHFHITLPEWLSTQRQVLGSLFKSLSYLAVPTVGFTKQKGCHLSCSLEVYFNHFSSMMKAFEFPVNDSNGKTKYFELQQSEDLTFSFCILDSNWQSLGDVALINYPSLDNKEPAFSSSKVRKDIKNCVFVIKLAQARKAQSQATNWPKARIKQL